MLSGFLFDSTIESVDVSHSIDNTSDHDPLMLNLCMDLERVACCETTFVDRFAWHKAETQHIEDYQYKLKNALNNIDRLRLCYVMMLCAATPITLLLLIDTLIVLHKLVYLLLMVRYLMQAFLAFLVIVLIVLFLGGPILSSLPVRNHYFGIILGWNADDRKREWLQILCGELDWLIIILSEKLNDERRT